MFRLSNISRHLLTGLNLSGKRGANMKRVHLIILALFVAFTSVATFAFAGQVRGKVHMVRYKSGDSEVRFNFVSKERKGIRHKCTKNVHGQPWFVLEKNAKNQLLLRLLLEANNHDKHVTVNYKCTNKEAVINEVTTF